VKFEKCAVFIYNCFYWRILYSASACHNSVVVGTTEFHARQDAREHLITDVAQRRISRSRVNRLLRKTRKTVHKSTSWIRV